MTTEILRGKSMSLITGVDHIVILVRDLAAAEQAYATLLARAPAWRQVACGSSPLVLGGARDRPGAGPRAVRGGNVRAGPALVP